MKNLKMKNILFLLLISFSISRLLAQDIQYKEKVANLLQDIVGYEYGDDRTPLSEFEKIVVNALNQKINDDYLEEKMLEALQSDAKIDGKRFICRELSLIGTKKSIDVLLTMVKNFKTSNMARYALEKIEGEEVDQGMFNLLNSVEDPIKIGIINSLANRKSISSLPVLSKLVTNENSDVALAASSAIGKIGGSEGALAIEKLLLVSNYGIRKVLNDSYLKCADDLVLEGEIDEGQKIYKKVMNNSENSSNKLAALKGLIKSSPKLRSDIIIDALKSNDKLLVQIAVDQLSMLESQSEKQKLVNEFSNLNVDTKIVLLNKISEMKSDYYLDLVRDNCKGNFPEVKVSAIKCLGSIGKASDVDLLSNLATSSESQTKLVAQTALYSMRGKDVDKKIIDELRNVEPKIQLEFIKAIGERRSDNGLTALIEASKSKVAKVRVEAYQALGVIAEPEHLDELLDIFRKIESEKELKRMENSIAKVALKIEEKNKRADLLLESLEKTDNFEKEMSIIRILGSTGDKNAYEKIEHFLNDENDEVVKTAIQSLYNWPNLEPKERLLEIVKTTKNNTHKILALRGYVNLLKNVGPTNKVDLTDDYAEAMNYSDNSNEQKLVLSGLGQVKTVKAVNYVLSFLDNEELKPEAEQALFEILIDWIRWSDPDVGLKAFKKMAENPSSDETKNKLDQLIKEMTKN